MHVTFWLRNPAVWGSLLLVAASGCARDTIETRRQERAAAYAGLPDEDRQLVDVGKIKVGMSMDGVYIAWGKPDQAFSTESEQGTTTTWIYHGTHLEGRRYWAYRPIYSRNTYYSEPYVAHDYEVRHYVSAEVVFQAGIVKEWRTLPYPVY